MFFQYCENGPEKQWHAHQRDERCATGPRSAGNRTMDEPMTGEKGKKNVTRVIDKDKHVFEIYDVTAWGEKQPVMVITYTRKKL
jgi:hypothetical protein